MPPRQQPQVCEVCSEGQSKYRCAGCNVRYCSVPCFKAHKLGSTGEDGSQARQPCTGKRARPGDDAGRPSAETSAPALRQQQQREQQQEQKHRQTQQPQQQEQQEQQPQQDQQQEQQQGAQATPASGATPAAPEPPQVRAAPPPPPPPPRPAPTTAEAEEEEGWQLSAEHKQNLQKCDWLRAALRDPELQKLVTGINRAADREAELTFHRSNPQFAALVDRMLLEAGLLAANGDGDPEFVPLAQVKRR